MAGSTGLHVVETGFGTAVSGRVPVRALPSLQTNVRLHRIVGVRASAMDVFTVAAFWSLLSAQTEQALSLAQSARDKVEVTRILTQSWEQACAVTL